jgi:hypothetical protein
VRPFRGYRGFSVNNPMKQMNRGRAATNGIREMISRLPRGSDDDDTPGIFVIDPIGHLTDRS